MARQVMAIVNASGVLKDNEVEYVIPIMQKCIDSMVMPEWQKHATDVELQFLPGSQIGNIPAGAWPMFLNRHSTDPGAVGWHTEDGREVYGRTYVGDCLNYGIEWTVDLSHEIFETMGDPTAELMITLPNGDQTAQELCDAVEDDAQAIVIDDVKLSNFVLPSYYGIGSGSKFDYRGNLHGACPTLTNGGYMEILKKGATNWSQIQQDHQNGRAGIRAAMMRFRRLKRRDFVMY